MRKPRALPSALERADHAVWDAAQTMGLARSAYQHAERDYLKAREIRDGLRNRLSLTSSPLKLDR